MRARKRLRGLARTARRRTGARLGPWPAIGVGALTAVSIGGHWGLVVGVAAALIAHVMLRRRETPQVRRARVRDLADLPFGLDVFACCLRAGAPLDAALATTAEAVNSTLAERLRRAARGLRLGATTGEALSELDGVPAAERITAAIDRSVDTGAMLADGLTLLAEELRVEAEQSALARAHRAGVWMVLPLCLCFLPAFIVAGLIPVVISSLAGILNTY